jgi:hypothetical protein
MKKGFEVMSSDAVSGPTVLNVARFRQTFSFSNSCKQRKPGDWDCRSCGTVNFKSRTECKQCSLSHNSNHAPPATPVVRPGDWHCLACTTHNFASRNVCKACETPKPAAGGKTASRGSALQVDRGAKLVVFRKGDWLCGKCQDHQFASNTSCRKCGKSRPVAAGEESADGSECVVCFENMKTAGLLHGDDVHMCCCKECAASLRQCPMCRAPIERVLNVYQ